MERINEILGKISGIVVAVSRGDGDARDEHQTNLINDMFEGSDVTALDEWAAEELGSCRHGYITAEIRESLGDELSEEEYNLLDEFLDEINEKYVGD